MFTNWLTTTSTASPSQSQQHPPQLYHHAQNPLPPDIVIEIGPLPSTKFAAHAAIICVHSGYFRAVINREQNENVIYVPNISTEQFSPLLTYMYTGFLDLTIENIFGVLLATHILHMPRALEICRSFLTRSQQDGYLGGFFIPTVSMPLALPQANTKIIRPIPNKATIETGLSFISTPIVSNHILLGSNDTKFRKINERSNAVSVPPIETIRERSPLPSTSKQNSEKIKIIKTTTTTVEKPIVAAIISDDISTPKPLQMVQTQSKLLEVGQSGDPKIIIDIASCDGPVRFRRVLNDAYGRLSSSKNSTQIVSSSSSLLSVVDESKKRTNINTSFHQQMARNISERNNAQIHSEESENSEDTSSNALNKDSNEFYVCVYCKHTFKSQYCYQKHAKRHINPLSMDSNDSNIDILEEKSLDKNIAATSKIDSTAQQSQNYTSSTNKREVRPLDMNVQYYPCKTCGCKFPSYYFVHKHRKMCHADEENP